MLNSALLTLAAAGAALAFPNAPEPRYEVVQIRQLVSSSASSPSSMSMPDMGSAMPSSAGGEPSGIGMETACMPDPSVLSLLETVPTPPADLLSITITDLCATPTFTGTEAAEWTSYTKAILSWYTKNSAALMSFESSLSSACPQAATFSNSAVPGVCTAVSTGSGSSSGGSSSGGSSNGSGSSGSTATGSSGSSAGASSAGGAAPMQTLVGYAAGLAAGFVGVVAAL